MKKTFLAALMMILCASMINAQDFQPGQAKVTASALKVRNIPSTGGVEVFSFNRGDVFDVIERSTSKSTVDGIEDFWYKVKYTDKKTPATGWVFGGYVSFELNMESGLRWKAITPTGGLEISAIALGDNGDIFLGTDGNLFISSDNGKTWKKVVPQALGINIGKINKIAIIGKDIFIAAGRAISGGVWKSANNGVSWSQATKAQGLNSADVNDIILGADKKLYTATSEGICVSSDNGATWKPIPEPSLSMNILSLVAAPSGQLFAGTDNGVYTLTDVKKMFGGMKKDWVRVGEKSPNMGKEISAIAISPAGDIFVGTNRGLNKSSVASLDKWYGIGGTVSVNDILIEGTSRISVATDYGLNISLDQGASWVTYKQANGLASNIVRKITLNKKKKTLWVTSGTEAVCTHD
jgi:photosystem II stability/assembly factor-like uncharacterized protein